MRLFKFFWTTHKWVGIVLALLLLNTAGTGFLLLIKKDHDWLQPPTRTGAAVDGSAFISIERLFAVVASAGHPDFTSPADIDRVDFRPDDRVHKVRSRRGWAELQVDAVTGEILSRGFRTSDLVESLHDGSFFGAFVHGWVMPAVAAGICWLVGSGLYLWLAPVLRRRAARRRAGARS